MLCVDRVPITGILTWPAVYRTRQRDRFAWLGRIFVNDEVKTWNKQTPAYRLYEVQNGNHIETFQDSFAQLELIEPHAQRAFDLLVGQVERGATLPPDQCIPRGGAISDPPAQPGHCASLQVP